MSKIKKIFLYIFLGLVLLTLSGCDFFSNAQNSNDFSNINNNQQTTVNTVARFYVDGSIYEEQRYNFIDGKGYIIKSPKEPVRDGKNFLYWETISGAEYVFNKVEHEDISLFARFHVNITETEVNFYVDGKVAINQHYQYTGRDGYYVSDPGSSFKAGHIFLRWETVEGIEYLFTELEYISIDLFAVFEFSVVNASSIIQNNYIRANVEIEVTSYNTTFFGWIRVDIVSTQGSGVIFHEQDGKYFLLTNSHVVENNNRSNTEYKIIDSFGNTYTGHLQKNSDQPQYDLAVLYFNKGRDLKVIQRASQNPLVGDRVITMGQPGGVNNVVTFGFLINYRAVIVNGTRHNFEAVNHSAVIKSGSSGGALLNSEFKLIGINFAGGVTSNGESTGNYYAIPILKVNEYLSRYIWS